MSLEIRFVVFCTALPPVAHWCQSSKKKRREWGEWRLFQLRLKNLAVQLWVVLGGLDLKRHKRDFQFLSNVSVLSAFQSCSHPRGMFRSPEANIPKNHNFWIFHWGLDSILRNFISEACFCFSSFQDSTLWSFIGQTWYGRWNHCVYIYMLTLGEKTPLATGDFDLTC